MLARALGARVFSYDDKRNEIGYYLIDPTLIGDRLCPAPFPRTVYQWHSDGFNLPQRAKLLAVGGANFQTKPMVKAHMQSACSSTRKSPIA